MNSNPQKFTPQELKDLYEKCILLWENGNLMNEKFDVRSGKNYRRIKSKFGLTLKSMTTERDVQTEFQLLKSNTLINENLFCFHNSKKNLLKSYFYYLRNIAAHADIVKKRISGVNWYFIEHKSRNKIKFFGQIKSSNYWSVRNEFLKLKR
jgi:hypothetical protein